jgi:hypothetical protein
MAALRHADRRPKYPVKCVQSKETVVNVHLKATLGFLASTGII